MANDTAELLQPREKGASKPTASGSLYRERRAESPPSDMAKAISQFGRDIYCVIDESLYCHSLSQNWQSISGYSAEDDIGFGFKDHIAPDHLRKVTLYLLEADPESQVTFQIKHKNGEWRWCEMQLISQGSGSSSTQKFSCLLRDVNELVETQSTLEKARLETDLAIKSRSEFLANMSHELRTPLNAILGFAQMIENGTFGEIGHPKYHDYVGSIQESGSTLLSKINDLLEIATIDSGRMDIRETSVDVASLISHVIEFHSHRAFSGHIKLNERKNKNPLWVRGDRIRLLQVLTNIVSNAIKYTREEGCVEVYAVKRRDGGINIIIEDNGGGISGAHLKNILSAFSQDNSFFARSRDCVGLGLALSKEIVKLHQGRIEIVSEPGQGTMVTVNLPAERTIQEPVITAPVSEKLA